jgi:hypothetical protein
LSEQKLLFVVGADEYDAIEAIQGASINSVRMLKAATKGMLETAEGEPKFQGVTPMGIAAFIDELTKKAGEADFDPIAILSDDSYLLHMQALVWLSKRRAGDPITFDDAGESGFAEVQFRVEGEPEGETPDPKDEAISVEDAPLEP